MRRLLFRIPGRSWQRVALALIAATVTSCQHNFDFIIGQCSDRDLGSARGNRVATGTTAGSHSTYTSCAGSGPEVEFSWTAPTAGTYVIDTVGSTFDTVLSVRDSDCQTRLVCNDDSVATQSRVTVTLAAAQVVTIIVDSFTTAGGNYVLNINGGGTVIPDGGRPPPVDSGVDRCGGECPSGSVCSSTQGCVPLRCGSTSFFNTQCMDYRCAENALCGPTCTPSSTTVCSCGDCRSGYTAVHCDGAPCSTSRMCTYPNWWCRPN